MGKIITTIQNRFDGGMVNSLLGARENECATMLHFDATTDPHILRPLKSTTSNITGQVGVGQLLVGADGLFYGLGTISSNGTIYKKATYAGDWAELGSGTSRSGAGVEYSLFVEYRNYFFYWKAGFLGKYDRVGVASSDPTFVTLSWSTVRTNGIIHPKDDILYIPYDNKIGKLNTAAGATPVTGDWTAAALTLPVNLVITAIAPYGNYLAIACAPLNGSPTQGSIIYLWDRDSSLATLSENINWGNNIIRVLNNLNGVLIGISDMGTTSESLYESKLQIKGWNGGFVFEKEFISKSETSASASVTIYPRVNFIYDNKMYFSADVQSAEPRKRGLWTIKQNRFGAHIVSVERVGTTSNSDTVAVLAAAIIGDRMLTVYTSAGTIDITTSTASAAYGTSTCVTRIFNDGDSSSIKKLIGITVMSTPLISTAGIDVYYRKDEETAWTLIFSHTVDNSISYSAINIESSGATLPQFKEIQFQIKASGGAEITGWKFKSEFIDKDIY